MSLRAQRYIVTEWRRIPLPYNKKAAAEATAF
jgi:hypothetical protein